jgi:subtilisin family serine protease
MEQTVTGRNLRVHVEYLNRDPHNGDYNLRVRFRRATGSTALQPEEWRIFIVNWSDDIELHAWSARLIGAFLDAQASDDSHVIGSPGTARDAVTVASSNTRLNWQNIDGTTQNFRQTRLGDISSFSSPGPLRTCSTRLLKLFGLTLDLTPPAIDVAAPGSAIVSALANNVNVAASLADGSPNRNRQDVVNQNSWMMQGTSMAAPLVTGLVACLLAEEPTLTAADVLRRIREAGRLPAGNATVFDPNSPDENDWGKGLVNAPRLKP